MSAAQRQKQLDAATQRVEKLLENPLWRGRSARWVAAKARASQYLVGKVRRALGAVPVSVEVRTKHGVVTQMRVDSINRRRPTPRTPAEGLALIEALGRQMAARPWRKTSADWFRERLLALADATEKTAALVRALA